MHQRALTDEGPSRAQTKSEVCGVPRFDFYFEPWRKLYEGMSVSKTGRPKILVCTNLAMARYLGLADSDAARFFEPFLRISGYQDYRTLIACHGRAREKLMLHLEVPTTPL